LKVIEPERSTPIARPPAVAAVDVSDVLGPVVRS